MRWPCDDLATCHECILRLAGVSWGGLQSPVTKIYNSFIQEPENAVISGICTHCHCHFRIGH